ncbi:MAG TPA: hypothetical protein DDZ44_07075 [Syntrophomonas wolfei]|uniref:Uncharacterized protein n=1 Tax=Syntrophomonas wolfei TaxID=863 RepID=A0A354YWU5_9FIRM|nr:hypothetical protein [Syntrophomonas wolfei]
MIPEPYNSWPVVMSTNKAAKLLGVDRKTLAKNKKMLDRCSATIGDKSKVIRDRLLRELKII